ncbi:MAG: DNA-deoxyinosine glycosylase [Hungatella sp.]
MLVTHTLLPIYHDDSAILILGTMPSPKSRELGFYYGHPRNRFWPILADIFAEPHPISIEDKIALCRRHRIALWDVLASCEIQGADDHSIKDPIANNMSVVLDHAPIKTICTTGLTAYALYQKYCCPTPHIPVLSLPSTSPANCRTSYEDLRNAYLALLPYTSI